MKHYSPRFTREASNIIAHLPPEAKRLIRASIDELITKPAKGNELQMELSGFRSLRSKKYRIIYRVNEADDSIDVYYVGPRKDVYDNFRELLERWKRER